MRLLFQLESLPVFTQKGFARIIIVSKAKAFLKKKVHILELLLETAYTYYVPVSVDHEC